MKSSKNPINRRERSTRYILHLEVGFILVLALLIGAFNSPIYYEAKTLEPAKTFDPPTTIETPITVQIKTPPKPLLPVIPIVVPNNSVIDEEIIFSTEDFSIGLPIPVAEKKVEPITDFVALEKEPQINGGYAQIVKHLVYPELAVKAGISGKVILSFTVNEKGQISDIKVLRSLGGGCDEAAITALKKVSFSPGIQRGRPVSVKFTLPVTFRLQ